MKTVRMLEPVRTPERNTPSSVSDADDILRQVSALLGHDFIAATRLLAALEAFSHRLPPLERTQFSRLMYSTAHAIGQTCREPR
jgi:hypothetical protein